MKNHSFHLRGTFAALLFTLVLAACGGGSDDDGTEVVKPVISEETARLRRMAEPAPVPGAPIAAPGAPAATSAALAAGT